MKLTVLVDNNTLSDQVFMSEHGLSYFIEVDSKNILFDVGYSDVFLNNAQKMGHRPAKTGYCGSFSRPSGPYLGIKAPGEIFRSGKQTVRKNQC